MENKNNKDTKKTKKELRNEGRRLKEINDAKNYKIARAEYFDELLLDPDNSQRQINRYEKKKKKLLASDKGVSNKVRDRRIFIVILLATIALGLMLLYFEFN